MSELTEAQLDQLCAQAADGCASLMGDQLQGVHLAYHHIPLFSAASALMGIAARSLPACFNKDMARDDPRMVTLMREWGAAFRAYPDMQGIGTLMNDARDRFYESLKD